MKKLVMMALVGLLGLLPVQGVFAQPGMGPGGGQVLKLRDANGAPAWAGQRWQ